MKIDPWANYWIVRDWILENCNLQARLPEFDCNKVVEIRVIGKRAVNQELKWSQKLGYKVEVIENANGCRGCFARTDAIATRQLFESEVQEKIQERQKQKEALLEARASRLVSVLRVKSIPWQIRKAVKSAKKSVRGYGWIGSTPLTDYLTEQGLNKRQIKTLIYYYGYKLPTAKTVFKVAAG